MRASGDGTGVGAHHGLPSCQRTSSRHFAITVMHNGHRSSQATGAGGFGIAYRCRVTSKSGHSLITSSQFDT